MRDPDSWTKHGLPTERPVESKYSQRIQARETDLHAGGRISDALIKVLKSKYIRIFGLKAALFSLAKLT